MQYTTHPRGQTRDSLAGRSPVHQVLRLHYQGPPVRSDHKLNPFQHQAMGKNFVLSRVGQVKVARSGLQPSPLEIDNPVSIRWEPSGHSGKAACPDTSLTGRQKRPWGPHLPSLRRVSGWENSIWHRCLCFLSGGLGDTRRSTTSNRADASQSDRANHTVHLKVTIASTSQG